MRTPVPHLTVVGPAHAQSVLADPQDARAAVDVTGYPVPTTNSHVRAYVRGRARFGRSLLCVQLPHADLSGLDVPGADFSHADLYGASFEKAELTGANFADADLRLANFEGADLTGANLRGADLLGARLDADTQMSGIDWDAATRWPIGFKAPEALFATAGQ